MQLFNRAFFTNGPNAGLIIHWEPPEGMTEQRVKDEKAKLLQYVERRFQSAADAHRPLLFGGAGKFTFDRTAAASKTDMAFEKGRKFGRDEILAVMGVPAAVLFSEQGRLGGNVQDEAHEQFRNTVESREAIIDEDFYVEFIVNTLGWDDVETKPAKRARRTSPQLAEAASKLAGIPGAFKIDEIRAVANFAPLGAEQGGDEFVGAPAQPQQSFENDGFMPPEKPNGKGKDAHAR